MYARKTQFIK